MEESRGKRLAASIAVAIVIVLVFAGSLASLGKYQPPKAGQLKGYIKVGCIVYPENTPLGKASQEIANGLKLWAEDANKTGINIQGQKFGAKIICKQVNPTPTEVRSATQNLITGEGVDVIVAPPGNALSLEVMRIGENRRVPVILTYANDNGKLFPGGGWNYTVMLMSPIFATVTAPLKALASNNVTIKNLAIIYESVPGNALKNFSARLSSYARSHKLNLAFSNPFSTENVSNVVSAMVTVNANPNVLYIVAWSSNALKAALDAVAKYKGQMTTLKHVVVIAPTNEIASLAKSEPTKLDRVLYVSMWEPIAPISPFMAANLGIDWYGYTTSEAFVQEYYQKYGEMPTDLAAMGYESGLLIQYAYEKAGSLDHTRVAEKMHSAYMMTFYGPVGFQGSEYFAGGSTGLQAAHKPLVVELVYTGGSLKKIILWPSEFATESYMP